MRPPRWKEKELNKNGAQLRSSDVDPGVHKGPKTAVHTKPEDPRGSSGLERKKETADVELSRRLGKPGKRNGTGFF